MFAIMVSRMNCQVSFPIMTMWSFVSLPSAVVAEGLAELDVKSEIKIEEGGMEIKKYVSLEEELAPETCTTNWKRVKKVIKALVI